MGRVIAKLLVVIILVISMVFLTGTKSQMRTTDTVSDAQATGSIGSGVGARDGERGDCFTIGELGESVVSGAAPRSTAMVSPLHTYVAPAETCTLQVWVGGSEDSLSCIECWVTFDTSLVELILAEEGELFESAPFQRLFFWQDIAPDTQSVEGCLLHHTAYTLLPGEIARYVFETKQPGVCPVKITRLNLFDKDRVMYQPTIDPNAWIIIGTSTGVDPPPVDNGEMRAFPNPFNPSTTLVLHVAGNAWSEADTHTTISIYSPAGQKVRDLFNGNISPGENRVTWDGKDERGAMVASGVYFAVAKTQTTTYKTKLVLVQ